MPNQPATPVDQPREFRITCTAPAVITAAEGEGKLPSFSGVAYTGAPMVPDGWWNPVIIDLAGVQVPSQKRPALRQHDHQQIVGHTTAIKVDASTGINVEGVCSGQAEHVAKVVEPARNGFPWQMSIGANPIRTEFLEAGKQAKVNGRDVTGPMTISRETSLGEVSFVPLGADGDTSATVTASKSKGHTMFKAALKELMAEQLRAGKVAKYSDADIDQMTADEARAALKDCMAAAGGDEPQAAGAAAIQAAMQTALADLRKNGAAELQRQGDITAACKRHGVVEVEIDGKKVNLAAHAIQENWTVDKVELTAIKAARPGPGVGVPGGLGYSTSTPAVSEAVLEAAVLHAARHQFRLQDDSFYFDPTPDGEGQMRRVPEYLQRQAQSDFTSRYTDQVQQAAHTIFKGRIGLHQLLEMGLRVNGYGEAIDLRSEPGIRAAMKAWDRLEPTGIRAEGASSLSISNILANVLNKFALQGYLYVEQAWRDVAAIRPVNDFKATKSINLLGDVMYKQLGPSGELSNADLADQAFANQAAPFGRILTIPWTHIVNDDLGMLTGVPMKIGQGAGLALNDAIWTLWKNMAGGTVNGDDGATFWRTTSDSATKNKMFNKNKISGGTSALSSASLQTAKAVFDNQVDPNGNPLGFDAGMPVLLFGPSNWVTATELLTYRELVGTGQTATPKQPSGNIWGGRMKPVMSRYIENAKYGNSTTAFWILFDPVALATIEVAFLNGVDTPSVLQAGPDYQFDRLGISIRGTMPFGVTQQNFRGGVFSVGA